MNKGFVKKLIKKAIFFSSLTFASVLLHAGTTSHWGYSGKQGPENWANLSPDFSLCSQGTEQSPVNIDTSKTKPAKLETIDINYNSQVLEVVNNGHTIQVNMVPGSKITIGNQEYSLLQFHFHTVSENTIDDMHYPMEVHFVHKNSQGQLGVLGVMIEKGTRNSSLEAILASSPIEKGKQAIKHDTHINPVNLLPSAKNKLVEYFNFPGSLTTPPCTESVNWLVAKQKVQASAKQLTEFNRILTANGQHHGNYRPVQHLNHRVIKEAAN